METFIKRAEPDREWALAVEAAGLRWLAAADGVRVVGVLEERPDALVLERLHPRSPTVAEAEDFGRALAATHAAGAPSFGSPPPECGESLTIGSMGLPMRPHRTFGEYAAHQLIEPFARTAPLPDGGRAVMSALAERLAAGDFDDDRPPARIHGDLWAGNVIWTDDGAVVIDPAAHGGHPVTDLAMLALFGCHHLGRIHAAHAEAAELPSGWEDLIELHQVWPLLVHANLFGSGYGAQAVAAARRYV
ncbi:phosphotransferase [Tessaracoccus rhinocerotis]|uniref:Phosphotransferase n=1 Tax=Tessaracoccus rhinocerotis TaxID=1689449 RepID=A0A553K0X7_9ACTN|nr:fructosamine kinase family protein [Tessaracoccus rhinocerotis]TRY18353.1 phosphotransferase [Tessaracoccus rhinocerotis]